MPWRAVLGVRKPLPAAAAVAGRVLVLAEGDNPSLAYFVRPRLRALGAEMVLVDARQDAEIDAAQFDAAVVIRYLPPRWQPLLRRLRQQGKGVAYFMDDDLMNERAAAGLPVDYQRKIERLARARRPVIEWLCSEFWVSTPYLATHYVAWAPQLLLPQVDAATLPARPAGAATAITICYHGTATHAAEQQWLQPVIGELQATLQQTHFNIIGDASVHRQFRGLPRVTVLHPMSWPNYLAWTTLQACDIGLAPLLPGPFNAARGATKFFDFARMGAVGIYADVAPYRDVVRDGKDGILLAMNPDDWVAAICDLVGNPERRRELVAAARRRAAAGLHS